MTEKHTLNNLVRAREAASSGEARRIRERSALSLRDLAGAVGVSPVTILRWERGDGRVGAQHAASYLAALDELRRLTGPRGRCVTPGCDFRAEPGGDLCWTCRADSLAGREPNAEAFRSYERGEPVPDDPAAS
jgi:transcriptional regulator with XRE-family HTH domain